VCENRVRGVGVIIRRETRRPAVCNEARGAGVRSSSSRGVDCHRVAKSTTRQQRYCTADPFICSIDRAAVDSMALRQKLTTTRGAFAWNVD
jgi:hypothetical protein